MLISPKFCREFIVWSRRLLCFALNEEGIQTAESKFPLPGLLCMQTAETEKGDHF
jgi:hypothetical protein